MNKNRSRFQIETKKIRKLCMHLLFFFARISVFSLLYFQVNSHNPTTLTVLVDYEDLTYLSLLNLFVLYLLFKAQIEGNVYKYYLSIIMLIHNTIVTMGVPLLQIENIFNIFWKGYTIISSLYLLEIIISLIIFYTERNENNLELFKKIGLNPEINNAYAARKRLETLAEINIFMSVLIQGKFQHPKSIYFRRLYIMKIVDMLFTIVQQIFIFADLKEENIHQRKIAIYLSVVNIIFPIVLYIWEMFLYKGDPAIQSQFSKIIYFDMLIITIFMTIFLINDYSKFGSGLKDYMKIKNKKLQISTNQRIR